MVVIPALLLSIKMRSMVKVTVYTMCMPLSLSKQGVLVVDEKTPTRTPKFYCPACGKVEEMYNAHLYYELEYCPSCYSYIMEKDKRIKENQLKLTRRLSAKYKDDFKGKGKKGRVFRDYDEEDDW